MKRDDNYFMKKRAIRIPLSDLSDLMPIFGQNRVERRGFVVERFHAECGEENPTVAIGATTDESGAVPPGFYKGLIRARGFAVQFELEIDPLEPTTAAFVRTTRVAVMNVRRRHVFQSPFSIDSIETFELGRGGRLCSHDDRLPVHPEQSDSVGAIHLDDFSTASI